MRILVTNDDGIAAPGLEVAEAIARDLSDDVWTVAPAFEQSGVGHCISYVKPTLVSKLGDRRFAIEGSPADCVLAAQRGLIEGGVDLVISGVNRGNNAGENALYSGTLGAAMEGALQGLRAVGLSQFYGPGNARADDPFEASRVHGAALMRRLLDADLWGRPGAYRTFYNVNFPPVPAAAVRGAAAVSQGYRGDGRMGVQPYDAPSGRQYMWVRGSAQAADTGPGTDVAANGRGWIAVTPMTADLTDRDTLERLALDGDGAEGDLVDARQAP